MAETVHRHLGTPMDQMTWTEAAHRLGVGVTDLVTWARERGAFCDADLDPGLDLVPSEVADAIRGIDEEKAKPSGRRAQVFAVTSGKGGVGKTSVSVNLATALAARGRRTILVDVDLGLADVHILAGTPPRRTLSDFVAGTAELVEVIGDGPRGLKIIAGGSGVKELADLDARGRARVLDAIESLRPHCDAILLDTGAGISSNVTDFLEIADHTICVTTSSFAAIADAYGVVKVLAQRNTPRSVHMIVNRGGRAGVPEAPGLLPEIPRLRAQLARIPSGGSERGGCSAEALALLRSVPDQRRGALPAEARDEPRRVSGTDAESARLRPRFANQIRGIQPRTARHAGKGNWR